MEDSSKKRYGTRSEQSVDPLYIVKQELPDEENFNDHTKDSRMVDFQEASSSNCSSKDPLTDEGKVSESSITCEDAVFTIHEVKAETTTTDANEASEEDEDVHESSYKRRKQDDEGKTGTNSRVSDKCGSTQQPMIGSNIHSHHGRPSRQRATKRQQQKLLEIMEKNSGTKDYQMSFWAEVGLQLNALGPSKTGKEWHRAWIEKKCTMKRKLLQTKQQHNMTSEGVRKCRSIADFDDREAMISKLDKRVVCVPNAICIGIPSPIERDPVKQQSGSSKPRRIADSNAPPQKKTTIEIQDHPIEASDQQQEKRKSTIETAPPKTNNNQDFKQIVIEQNNRIIHNLESFNELARTFVNSTLQFQQELLACLKKP